MTPSEYAKNATAALQNVLHILPSEFNAEGAAAVIEEAIRNATGERETRAQRDLREVQSAAQERVARLLSTSPAVVYSFKATGDFAPTFVSDNIIDVFGYAPAEYLEDPLFWRERVHPDDLARVEEAIAKFFQNGVHAVEYRFRRKDESYCWVNDEQRLIADADGKPLEIVGSWSDVTARKVAEEERAEAHARLSRLLSSSPAVIYSYRATGDFAPTFVSENIRHWLGYEPQEYLQHPDFWWSRVHPDDLAAVQVGVAQLFQKGLHTIEYRFLKKDGAYCWVYDLQQLVRDEDGQAVEVVGSWSDITERKQLGEALASAQETSLKEIREARTRLMDAIETISEGFSLYDAEDKLILCNSRYRELFASHADMMVPGTSFETILRTAVDRGLIKDAEGRGDAWIEDRIARHHAARETHVQRRSDGRWIQVSERRTANGGVVAIYADITALKRHEAELAAARDEAMGATQAKSKFLASMSHELRTPLNAIIGFTRLVMRRAKDALPAKQYENLEKVLVSAEHLLSLINTVLDLAKIEAGRTEVSPAEFPLEPLLDLCLTTVEPMVKADRVRLIKDVQGPLPVLYTDQGKLKQILINLLSNAAKFTETGSITLRGRSLGDRAEVAVADTGSGIPKAALELIFEEFSQVDDGPERGHNGTGLGLTISRQLARLLGGDITVESELGEGSTFTITLPVRLAGAPELKPTPSARAPAPPEAPIRPGEKIVLAIDDDRNVLHLLRENLADAGYRVIGAESGEEGLQKARELNPHAITLDIMMPDIDGWQVLHVLKSDPVTRDIPVILLSIVDRTDLGFRLGAADYLVKPFDSQALIGAVARVAPHCRRILVVDDDPNVPELVRQLCECEHFTIDWAADGGAGLEHLAQVRPDVILLDLVMPRMDGLAFLDALERNAAYKEIPVIMITAESLSPTDRRMLQERVLGLIEKRGLDREALIQELRRALPVGEAAEPSAAG